MAQSDFDFPIAGISGTVYTDNLEEAIMALVSTNAGTVPPAPTYEGQLYYNSTSKALSMYSDGAWRAIVPNVQAGALATAASVTTAQNTANAANSLAGTANANAVNAQNTANTAVTLANNANNNANTRLPYGGGTITGGLNVNGQIQTFTGLYSAGQISTPAGMNCNGQMASGSISTGQVNCGVVYSNTMYPANLDSSGFVRTYQLMEFRRTGVGGFGRLYQDTDDRMYLTCNRGDNGAANVFVKFNAYASYLTMDLFAPGWGGINWAGFYGNNPLAFGWSAPTLQMSVDGNNLGYLPITGNSDERIKDIHSEIDGLDAIDFITNSRAINYSYKEDYAGGLEGDRLGVVAQEVKQYYPQIVNLMKPIGVTDPDEMDDIELTEENGEYTVDYLQLIPVLMAAIKELSQQVEELKNAS